MMMRYQDDIRRTNGDRPCSIYDMHFAFMLLIRLVLTNIHSCLVAMWARRPSLTLIIFPKHSIPTLLPSQATCTQNSNNEINITPDNLSTLWCAKWKSEGVIVNRTCRIITPVDGDVFHEGFIVIWVQCNENGNSYFGRGNVPAANIFCHSEPLGYS